MSMPTAPVGIEHDCDVVQGYQFKKDVQLKCGFVNKLKIGDVEFEADQDINKPDAPDAKVQVVGVIKYFKWGGGEVHPGLFEFQISADNKAKAQELIQNRLDKNNCEIDFEIFNFDSGKAKAFYQCFHTGGSPFNGVLQKEAGAFVLSLNDTASSEVEQPENFLLVVGWNPQGTHDAQMATSASSKFVKPWGKESAAAQRWTSVSIAEQLSFFVRGNFGKSGIAPSINNTTYDRENMLSPVNDALSYIHYLEDELKSLPLRSNVFFDIVATMREKVESFAAWEDKAAFVELVEMLEDMLDVEIS